MANRLAALTGEGQRRGSFFNLQRKPSIDPGHVDSIIKVAASRVSSGLLSEANSAIGEEELSVGSFFLKSKKVFFENTFKMLPDKKFSRKKVETVATEVIERHSQTKGDLLNQQYTPDLAAKLCNMLSNEIKAKIKELGYDRYKLVVEVTCIPHQNQSLRMASQCLWDEKWDEYVVVEYDRNSSMKIIALIFGIYFE
uniref:Tctex1 domain-containing protein 3-like n=1 Tax=Saccoglossus kowalevskii TaxID=10224 RepID=A0ABM0MTE7_SACKO|nr:PREDICTED: tctex1 domain-containing protein 3-like [Saccoglossus kowalevskii]